VNTRLMVVLLFAAQVPVAAAEPDCYYGEGKYTVGTVHCQAGQTMQCRRDDEGRPVWTSLDQQCTDPAALADRQEVRIGETRPYFPGESPQAVKPKASADEIAGGRDGEDEENAAMSFARETGAVEALPADGPVIGILWAEYGRDGQSCDAAPALTERCEGKVRCDVHVGPRALCGDPVPGRQKLLSVYWTCEGGRESARQPAVYVRDDSDINLQCDG
jgi:hypothetical protein